MPVENVNGIALFGGEVKKHARSGGLANESFTKCEFGGVRGIRDGEGSCSGQPRVHIAR